MKVLHLANVIGDHKGGGVNEVVSNLYKNQKRLQHEPHIWYPGENDDANLFREDENIVALPTFGDSKYGLVKKIFHPAPKEMHYDIIHQHGIWMPISILSKKLRKKNNFKSVVQPHGYLLKHNFNISKYKKIFAFNLFEKSNLRSTDVLVSCASYEAQSLKKLFPQKEIAIIPNGVSLDFINAKKRLGNYQNSKKKMLFLSQINPIKGIERVLRAINSIGIEKFSHWEFIIAGYENKSYKKLLLKMIDQLGLGDLVSFIGPKFGQDKIDEFDSADIMILPSFNENFGIVVAEALARGLPVITTKGTPWEELNEKKCGFWVNNNDEGIKSGLIKLLETPEKELNKMGERGRQLIQEKDLWENISIKSIKLYDWVINGGTKPDFFL